MADRLTPGQFAALLPERPRSIRPIRWAAATAPISDRITFDKLLPLLRFPFPLDRMAQISPGYTANHAVNSDNAAPSVVTTAQRPALHPNSLTWLARSRDSIPKFGSYSTMWIPRLR